MFIIKTRAFLFFLVLFSVLGFQEFHQFTVFTSGRDAFTVVSRRSRGVHGGFHGREVVGVHIFHGGGSRHSVYGGI
ncbi:hypothetical protein Hanom_Chr12g01116711 [Helianthus anomalus]